MALDGMMIKALVEELNMIIGGKITKIYQPMVRDLLFHIRAHNRNHRLLISADPTHPRLHFTTKVWLNPQQAPMFCMVLRKYVEGGVIEKIFQPDLERIIWLDIRSKTEIGDKKMTRLVVELMGRHSNIILMDPQTGQIIDSIHHLSSAVNTYRTVLPGHVYVPPPDQDKQNPLSTDKHTFLSKLDFNSGKLDRQIVEQFRGISPLLAKEILHQAGLPTQERLWASFNQIMDRIKNKRYQPCVINASTSSFYYLFPLAHLQGEVTCYPRISPMLEEYYSVKVDNDRLKQMVTELSRMVRQELKKNKKKQSILMQTLQESKQGEQWRIYGELLTAFLHQVEQGAKEVEVPNYYADDGSTLLIPLDPSLSPNQNAQNYFKKYNKAKVAREKAAAQLAQTEAEITYLETVLHQLEQASKSDLEQIKAELTEEGYIRDRNRGQAKTKTKKQIPEPVTFFSSEGIPISVGKNNKQNEYLTMRLAAPHDTWLHTKEIPGSHVVIRSKKFGEATLREAAQLAAYFSKARHSSQVPVDYTLIKHVRKPKGAKPGFVIYDQQRTIFVTPNEELIQQLTTKS